MDITLNWKNYNGGQEDSVKIYRALSAIDSADLPTPIATLPAGATSYTDVGVTRGTTYYYRIAFFKGTDSYISDNRVIRAVAATDTGPGPQTLSSGDWAAGIFGRVPASQLITYSGLAQFLGFTAGTALSASPEKDWLKVAIDGKVLFVALSGYRYKFSYLDLYNAGAVYGTNDNGLIVPTGATPTNQYKPYALNGNVLLIPRILKGVPDNQTTVPVNDTANASKWLSAYAGKSEYETLMGMVGGFPRYLNDTSYANLNNLNDEIGGLPPASNQTYLSYFCQQPASFPAGTALLRGGRGFISNTIGDFYPGPAFGFGVSATSITASVFGGSSATMYGTYRPVLELDI